jgi:hypothetical protein
MNSRSSAAEKQQSSKWRYWTTIFIAMTTLLVIVYDAFVAFVKNDSAGTISRRMQAIGMDHWCVPFAIGFVFVSHFFWAGFPMLRQPWAFAIGAAVFGGLLVLDVIGMTPRLNTMYLLAAGVILGRLCWPLSPV